MADWRIAIVEADRFGGSCLNRGCIPSSCSAHGLDVAGARLGAFGVTACR
jgi:pyruvate/2-oxoglutarate dehydrogenase complex dihydrolipoamide dehydrogenase (E3) component